MAGFIGRTGRYVLLLLIILHVSLLTLYFSFSGKSTIFLVLLGFLPYEGSVTIDGLEVSKIPRKVLRSRVTAIPQDGLILPGTIRQNLMPWLLNESEPTSDQCSTSDIMQVLEDTMLADKISLDSLDTHIDELGFSAGERQLFSVARSMLLNLWNGRRIVLMDEASSNVDVETDEKLHLAIGKAFQDRTICSITHRIETV